MWLISNKANQHLLLNIMYSHIGKISFILTKHVPLKIQPCKKSVLHFSPLNKKRTEMEEVVNRKELGVTKSGEKGRL